jgi:hypothetical protein
MDEMNDQPLRNSETRLMPTASRTDVSFVVVVAIASIEVAPFGCSVWASLRTVSISCVDRVVEI